MYEAIPSLRDETQPLQKISDSLLRDTEMREKLHERLSQAQDTIRGLLGNDLCPNGVRNAVNLEASQKETR